MIPQIPILQRTHWIFDLDGTLTVPVHDFNAIRQTLGLSAQSDILASLAALPEAEATVLREKLDAIEIELARQARPAQGARALLSTIYQRGYQIGVLTRNSQQNAWLTLKVLGVESYFSQECVLGRENAAHKPNPEGILKLSKLWGTQPQDTVMIGDYLFDLQAGRAAGAATIHVDRTGTFPWKDWMDLGVGNLEELHEKLINFKN